MVQPLYLRVTVAVKAAVAGATFHDPTFLARLDIVFANLYFDAAAAGDSNPQDAPAAWRPLFQSRHDRGIARLQFALAGMNAHINRDLPVALVRTCGELDIDFRNGSPEQADFEQINALLAQVEAESNRIHHRTGRYDRRPCRSGRRSHRDVEMRRARQIAWSNAELLWHLRTAPRLKDQFFGQLDSFTGFAGAVC